LPSAEQGRRVRPVEGGAVDRAGEIGDEHAAVDSESKARPIHSIKLEKTYRGRSLAEAHPEVHDSRCCHAGVSAVGPVEQRCRDSKSRSTGRANVAAKQLEVRAVDGVLTPRYVVVRSPDLPSPALSPLSGSNKAAGIRIDGEAPHHWLLSCRTASPRGSYLDERSMFEPSNWHAHAACLRDSTSRLPLGLVDCSCFGVKVRPGAMIVVRFAVEIAAEDGFRHWLCGLPMFVHLQMPGRKSTPQPSATFCPRLAAYDGPNRPGLAERTRPAPRSRRRFRPQTTLHVSRGR